MRRFFLAVFVLGLLTWGLPASAQQACFGPSCPGGGTTFSAAVASGPTYCADAGASDAYACDLSVAPASYNAVKGVPLTFTANTVNTGAATISFNSLGAQAIVKVGATTTTALQTNDIRAGSLVTVQWDGSNFECLSCNGNYANLAIGNTWLQSQIFPAGAAATPSVAVGGPGQGIYNRSAGRVTIVSSGSPNIEFDTGGSYLSSAGTHYFLSGVLGSGIDLSLVRQGVGVLRIGNGSTGYGWVAQHGEVALNAAYTNATTTFSNTALAATLVSGRAYNFTVNLILSDSTAADGVKIDFNGGTAAMTVFNVSCMMTNDTTGATVAFTAATAAALATTINAATLASTGNHMLVCNGGMVPSGNGTFILRAAQNAHTTGTLTITRGSWMSVRDARPL